MKGRNFVAVHIRGRKLNLLIKKQAMSSGYSSFDEVLAGVTLSKDDAEWLIATLSQHFFNKRVIMSHGDSNRV
jgi:hypothetical protein